MAFSSDNRFKVEQIFHKLSIIVPYISDKITDRDGNTRPNTSGYVERIQNKLKENGIEIGIKNTFYDVGKRYGIGKQATYKECFYNFKENFNDPTDDHIKFLELFADGFPNSVSVQ